MSEQARTVEMLLANLRRRQRGINALRWGVHGLLAGGAAACLAALLMWAGGLTDLGRLLVSALGITVFLGVAGAVAGMFAPISDLVLARALDRAGNGQDRFASALQLLEDRHQDRAKLVVEDALAHVKGTSAAAALPVRVPRTARWVPLPIAVLLLMLLVLPQPKLQAAPPATDEISPDQWKQIADEFNKQLAQLPKPLTQEEESLQKELEKLAEKLKDNPDKKDALKDIARLSDRVEQERKSISAPELSLRKAAKAMNKSQALKQLAAKMKQGAYQDASQEMKAVAAKLKNGEMSPDAEEFENMAQDLENLAKELDADKELQTECQGASGAASKMNKKELSDALKRMAEQMAKNAGKYQRSDNLAKHKSMLDELKRRMNQGKCEGDDDDGEGDGLCQGDKPGKRGGKGGLKAGWGSMAKWDGGKLGRIDEKRKGEMSDSQENPGMSSTFEIVSPDEKAKSGKRYEELYAEFVQKAEADLDLDSVPVSQREYLRKYFKSIKPQEPAEEKADPASP